MCSYNRTSSQEKSDSIFLPWSSVHAAIATCIAIVVSTDDFTDADDIRMTYTYTWKKQLYGLIRRKICNLHYNFEAKIKVLAKVITKIKYNHVDEYNIIPI